MGEIKLRTKRKLLQQTSYIFLSWAFISTKTNHWRLNAFLKMLQKFPKHSDNIKNMQEVLLPQH